MNVAKALNLGLAFVLEMAMLFAFIYWGNHTHHLLLGILAGIAAVGIWAVFAAPKSSRRLKQPGLVILKSVLFIFAAIAFIAADCVSWALIFAVACFLNQSLAIYWRQEGVN